MGYLASWHPTHVNLSQDEKKHQDCVFTVRKLRDESRDWPVLDELEHDRHVNIYLGKWVGR